jgi:hypothetical protein
MSERVKRLAPTGETLRRLFLTSGNLCAFPGCSKLMMNETGVFIGQLCHIEAADVGGQRFNQGMTNEERRAFENLLLLCYEHHKITDDVPQFPVERLRQIKANHENRFSNPQRAMLEKLTDWTELDTPTTPQNLHRLNEVLEWGFNDEELQGILDELNAYIARFRTIPIELRRFLGAVVRRAWKMRDSNVVQTTVSNGTLVLISDIERALELSSSNVSANLSALESYSIMSLEQMETSFRPEPAIQIRPLRSGWGLWLDVILFSEKAGISLEVFTEDLNFGRLDG